MSDELKVPDGFFSEISEKISTRVNRLSQIIERMPTVSDPGPGVEGVAGILESVGEGSIELTQIGTEISSRLATLNKALESMQHATAEDIDKLTATFGE